MGGTGQEQFVTPKIGVWKSENLFFSNGTPLALGDSTASHVPSIALPAVTATPADDVKSSDKNKDGTSANGEPITSSLQLMQLPDLPKTSLELEWLPPFPKKYL